MMNRTRRIRKFCRVPLADRILGEVRPRLQLESDAEVDRVVDLDDDLGRCDVREKRKREDGNDCDPQERPGKSSRHALLLFLSTHSLESGRAPRPLRSHAGCRGPWSLG